MYNVDILLSFQFNAKIKYVMDINQRYSCSASARFRVMASHYGASRSRPLDAPHSVALLWRSDQPDEETSDNTHKRQTSMPPAEFEPTIPENERPQTHVLDRAATGIGNDRHTYKYVRNICINNNKYGDGAEFRGYGRKF